MNQLVGRVSLTHHHTNARHRDRDRRFKCGRVEDVRAGDRIRAIGHHGHRVGVIHGVVSVGPPRLEAVQLHVAVSDEGNVSSLVGRLVDVFRRPDGNGPQGGNEHERPQTHGEHEAQIVCQDATGLLLKNP